MPTLPTPATTGDVWGNQLNNFLKQLQSSADGSINYATTRPTKTASDVGYTMIDTTTREIIRWSGTAWEVLLQGYLGSELIKLPADLDLYVATNGSDSNDGLSAAKPFLTAQKAIDTAYKYYVNDYAITIKVAPGTYPSQIKQITGKMYGETDRTPLRIVGTGANPSDVVFQQDTNLEVNFDIGGEARVYLGNMKLVYVGDMNSIAKNSWTSIRSHKANVLIDKIDFGTQHPTKGYHIVGFDGTIANPLSGEFFTGSTNITVSGGALAHMWAHWKNGNITIACNNGNVNYTFLNNPTVSIWAQSVFGASVYFENGNGLTQGVYGYNLTGAKNVITKWSCVNGSSVLGVANMPGADGNAVTSLANYGLVG